LENASIDELFARALRGEYDDEPAWEAVRALRRIGSCEVFDRAADWCRSNDPLQRARGADVLAQLGKTPEHPSNSFPEESYRAISEMLLRETEILPLEAAITALGHLDNPAAIPLIIAHQNHPTCDVRFAVAFALGSFPNEAESIRTLLTLMDDSDDDYVIGPVYETNSGNVAGHSLK